MRLLKSFGEERWEYWRSCCRAKARDDAESIVNVYGLRGVPLVGSEGGRGDWSLEVGEAGQ
jgi:hypothetical protein